MAGGPTVNLAHRVRPLRRALRDLRQPARPRPTTTVDSGRRRASSRPRSRPGLHGRATRPTPAERGRPPARRPDRLLQRHAGRRLGPAPAADPRQRRRRRRRSWSSATASELHARPPTPPSHRGPLDDGRDAARRRSASSACRPSRTATTGGPLYTLEPDGRHDRRRRSRRSATLPVKVYGVGQAIVGARGARPRQPGQHRRRRPVRRRGRVARATSRSTEKVVILLMLIAGFNFFVGMFNFVPLLPLDGGHIAGALSRPSAAGSPGCAAGPTPATSTSPSCCRSPTSWRLAMLRDGRRADRRRHRRARCTSTD